MAWAESKDFRVPLVPSRPTACQGDYIGLTLENKKCFHSQESGQVLLTLGLGVALPSVVGYVGAVRESKVLLVHHFSCQPLSIFQPPCLNLSPGAARPLPLPPSPCLGSPAPHPPPPARPPVLDLQGPLLLGQHLPRLLPGTRPRLVSIKLINP